jgi:hypothetical protein
VSPVISANGIPVGKVVDMATKMAPIDGICSGFLDAPTKANQFINVSLTRVVSQDML